MRSVDVLAALLVDPGGSVTVAATPPQPAIPSAGYCGAALRPGLVVILCVSKSPRWLHVPCSLRPLR